MTKKLLTILLIILANLLAFFLLGNILDALFETGVKITLFCVFFSLIPLIFWMFLYIKSIQKELGHILPKKDI